VKAVNPEIRETMQGIDMMVGYYVMYFLMINYSLSLFLRAS